ncbi:MAG: S-methyl-5-thioribose kinase, partial [Steroidobacteraceae bacterium]
DDRLAYRDWILAQTATFWDTFRERFLVLWRAEARGDVFPAALFADPAGAAALEAAREAFLQGLLGDMLGFAACKMIRRILGFAHVADFERIADAGARADCETGALALARLILTHPGQLSTVAEVLDAVPRMTGRA